MADTTDTTDPARLEQKRLGMAVRRLRERRGITQAKAAERMNISTQAWQRYEAGERRLAEHKLRTLAEALGADLEELMLERARIDSPVNGPADVVSLADRGRAFGHAARPGLLNELAGLLGPHADRLRLNTSAMQPWAESGEMIIFDRERPPRRDHGCVVETEAGELSVWIFDGHDEGGARVHRLWPEREDRAFAADELRGIYAVRFRGD